VTLRGERTGWERTASLVDLSLGGAGVESEEPLVPGEPLTIVLATPTMWDPLVLRAIVAWAHPLRTTDELDALGRMRLLSRAGLSFDYATPDATLAMFEMLTAIGFD
jgi:hypothetical protein